MATTNRRLTGTRAGVAAAIATMTLAGGAWWNMTIAAKETPPGASPSRGVALERSTASSTGVVPVRGSYADVVEKVTPAVVTIRVEGRAEASPVNMPDGDFFRRFFGEPLEEGAPRSFRQRGLGSGVIVSTDGYVLTNNHVVNGADDIRVDLVDGRSFHARLVGTDALSDLALLKVPATDLRPLTFGDSDAVHVGDVVLAVGNPLGIGQTVTMGIVSAKGRATGVGDGGYEDFLQTDAPINQGNSGGALVNLNGELIGINSQIVSTSGGNIGIGLAIPSGMAEHVMTLLTTEGRVRRAQLGITVQPVTADLAASLNLRGVSGAIVSSVAPGSPAARGGVQQGDVVISLDGQPVSDANVLRNRIAAATPGSRATLVVNRDGHQQEIVVTLGEAASRTARADTAASDADRRASLGVSVAPITPQAAEELGLSAGAHGLVVEEVVTDSRAADAGIQRGDVIESINRQPVRTVDDLRAAVRQTSSRPVLLLINRRGQELFLTASAS